MSEFGGLWKHQNNPACTKKEKKKKGHCLQNVEVAQNTEEEEEEEEEEEDPQTSINEN